MNAVELAGEQFEKTARNREEVNALPLALKGAIPVVGGMYVPHEVAARTGSIGEAYAHMAATGIVNNALGWGVGVFNPLAGTAASALGGGLTSTGMSAYHNKKTREENASKSLFSKLKDSIAQPTPLNVPLTMAPFGVGNLHVGAHTGSASESAKQGLIATLAGFSAAPFGAVPGALAGLANKPDYAGFASDGAWSLGNKAVRSVGKDSELAGRLADLVFSPNRSLSKRIPNGILGALVGGAAASGIGGSLGSRYASKRYNKKLEQGEYDLSAEDKLKAVAKTLREHFGS